MAAIRKANNRAGTVRRGVELLRSRFPGRRRNLRSAPARRSTLPSPKCKGPSGTHKNAAPRCSAGLHFATGAPQVLRYIVFADSQSCGHLGKRIPLYLLQDEHVPARRWQHESSQQGQLEGCFVSRGDGIATSQTLGPNLMPGNLHFALLGPITSCVAIGFRFLAARKFE